ncbi:MAG: rod shape-determining protein MreC [Lachnospiraceae bacterium]|jgi:rod shape-determining protein MreC|nr:rod shape-determining protein MreC [Lachnospiraceae bacterium]
MRKRTNIAIEPKVVLIAGIILCCLLIFFSFRYKEKMAPIKAAAGNVITPMQVGINRAGSWISDRLERFASVDELIEENNRLKEELYTLDYENKILLQNRYELDNFRKLYDLDQNYADYPKVAARVIANDSSNWYSNFRIDKGSEDGIAIDMNVMAGNGLVGIVTEVGKNWARVRSIIDDSTYVSGMFLKSSDTCMVKGNLELLEDGFIEVEDIKRDAEVKDGYEIVTSYLSDKYHPGILIGYLSNLTMDPSNMTKSGLLTPAVDFSRLDMVLIITQEKEPLEEDTP